MVPTPLHVPFLPRLLLTLTSSAAQYVFRLPYLSGVRAHVLAPLTKRDDTDHDSARFIVSACFIPVLVILSGVFAGLTLGYMSLDETQLSVLSISGTPKQQLYANKIKPIRKDGHLLLVTLLLANMIVNETLPVISDSVLGGGPQGVVVSTVLIVIFSEIIPQSLCTRYGLYFGAKMAGCVRVLMWTLGIVAWPVAKILEIVLGPHHGIIYRRAELKELIAMHENAGELGGDLKKDTVTIIGGALDLQEKVVKQAMTPIAEVFMLSIDEKLDYETLRKVCLTGHSRVPVYEEVEVPVSPLVAGTARLNQAINPMEAGGKPPKMKMQKVKKIIGILLVKQCVLLDPKDAVPVRKIPLNKVPFVPNNEPLLGILDRFQDGRSHMAIVSRFSVERAASVKQAVKRGLTQRLRDSVGMGDSESGSSSEEESAAGTRTHGRKRLGRKRRSKQDKIKEEDNENDNEDEDVLKGNDDHGKDGGGMSSPVNNEEVHASRKKHGRHGHGRKTESPADLEMGVIEGEDSIANASRRTTLPKTSFGGRWEQSMPADAVLTEEGAEEFLQSVDPAVMPLGIITLEDVLEELIGEEIYDEFDPQGHPDLSAYVQLEAKVAPSLKRKGSAPQLTQVCAENEQAIHNGSKSLTSTPIVRPIALPALKGLNFMGFTRSRSAPPVPRDEVGELPEKGDRINAAVTEGVAVSSEVTSGNTHNTFIDSKDCAPSGILPYIGSAHTEAAAAPPGYVVDLQARSPPPIFLPPPAAAPADDQHVGIGRPKAMGTGYFPVPPNNLNTSLTAGPVVQTSRASSPSPSLEHALRVERKRRATFGVASQVTPKGARFKSSPLTGERMGIVVAERVKRELDMRVRDGDGDDGVFLDDERISDEKDKVGPDKFQV